MLPERIVEFVNGPYFFGLGTRDRRLVPACSLVTGALADAGRDQVTLLVPDPELSTAMENLRQNGEVALLIGHDDGHETYQLKGRFVSARPCGAEEMAIRDLYLRKAEAFWHPYIGDFIYAYIGAFTWDRVTAITFRVEQIFDQTPGPGAGRPVPFEPADAVPPGQG